jgi:hypothetical protein
MKDADVLEEKISSMLAPFHEPSPFFLAGEDAK